jgi:uncharacterized membrane protein
MKEFIIAIISAGVLDFLWLGVIAKSFYRTHLAGLARVAADGSLQPIWSAALLVYILIPLGIVFFVLPKANGNVLAALGWGALFGIILYGVYDLTNYSTLKGWPVSLTIIDILWGAALCGIAAAVVTYFMK